MTSIAVTREGQGPTVLLVHGGAGATVTWRGLGALAAHWSLAFAHRRGFPPSPPPPAGRQDFQVDAEDLLPLLDERPHLVAHSYGALGSILAAGGRPDHVRSLTLLEPAIFVPRGDPDVEHLLHLGDTVLRDGPDTEPAALRTFLRLSDVDVPDGQPLPAAVRRGVERAQGSRSPGEADLPLAELRAAGVPALVGSGDHCPPLERMCDVVAAGLGAARVHAPGAGHFVAGAPGFADEFERFLRAHD